MSKLFKNFFTIFVSLLTLSCQDLNENFENPNEEKVVLMEVININKHERTVDFNDSTSSEISNCLEKDCFIRYDNFGIQRLYGLDKVKIESHGRKFKFYKSDLNKIIKKQIIDDGQYCDDYHYCDYDLKAKIVLNDNTYYIDSLGLMESEGRFYEIDKQALIELLNNRQPLK